MNIKICLFIACFIAHEFEEIMILPPWIQRHHHKLRGVLPTVLQPVLSISKTGFTVIALWEGMIIVTISLLFPESVWWFGMVTAYTLHLLLHCGQYFMLKKRTIPTPNLRTVPLELPLCLYIIVQGLAITSVTHLIFASAVWTALAVTNLAAAHAIWHYCSNRVKNTD